MSDTESPLSDHEQVAAFAFIDRLEKRGKQTPIYMAVTLLFSLFMFCQGLYWMYTSKQAMEPGPTILEKLDAQPRDTSVPAILQISGESRKGMLLIEAESQVRSFDAVLASSGFTIFAFGTIGLVLVYSRRRDGERDRITAKLLRCYLNEVVGGKRPTPS